jgi:hypothetical protein
MSEKPNFKKMSTEELRVYVRHNDSEEAFDEYASRLDWKTPPKFNSAEEEEQFIKDLIAHKTSS